MDEKVSAKSGPNIGTAFLSVFLLITITVTVCTFILPDVYESSARIKVVSRDSTSQQSQLEAVRSDLVLTRVVLRLDLNLIWGRAYKTSGHLSIPETRALLKRKLEVKGIRETSLVSIKAHSFDPKEAAQIANAIADEYLAYTLEQLKNPQVKDYMVAELIERAEPSPRPARPNRPLIITVGVMVAVFVAAAVAGAMVMLSAPGRQPQKGTE